MTIGSYLGAKSKKLEKYLSLEQIDVELGCFTSHATIEIRQIWEGKISSGNKTNSLRRISQISISLVYA
jgi:hypothetical protein